MSESAPTAAVGAVTMRGRPRSLTPSSVGLLTPFVMLAACLGACTGPSQEGSTTNTGTAAVDTTGSASSETTSTTESDVIDLGNAEALDGDPALVVDTEEYGAGPADQVLILMAEGQGRQQAEAVAAQLGGTIVGEVEYIQLYQIQTSGTTPEDLLAAIQAAAALPEVEGAFPNSVMVSSTAIEGKKCSPLRDPLYEGNNAIPYEMIGLQQAWDIIKASEVELKTVISGISARGCVR